eukprot:TRINITY_DN93310_c0_g1_i1.p1 TRINITY_DN93310_c0_g1~~TRINITY_DN93310_c0_g1_i1.p1  ORF type:complete len:392 (-),score=85.40 TRINITY_DN93310_c0_g1_i1:7-1161(-)
MLSLVKEKAVKAITLEKSELQIEIEREERERREREERDLLKEHGPDAELVDPARIMTTEELATLLEAVKEDAHRWHEQFAKSEEDKERLQLQLLQTHKKLKGLEADRRDAQNAASKEAAELLNRIHQLEAALEGKGQPLSAEVGLQVMLLAPEGNTEAGSPRNEDENWVLTELLSRAELQVNVMQAQLNEKTREVFDLQSEIGMERETVDNLRAELCTRESELAQLRERTNCLEAEMCEQPLRQKLDEERRRLCDKIDYLETRLREVQEAKLAREDQWAKELVVLRRQAERAHHPSEQPMSGRSFLNGLLPTSKTSFCGLGSIAIVLFVTFFLWTAMAAPKTRTSTLCQSRPAYHVAASSLPGAAAALNLTAANLTLPLDPGKV